MKLKRFWGNDIEVADYWMEPQQLAKHRIYMRFSNSDYLRSDENGFRVSDESDSLIDRYRINKDKKKIFCFGGSTTFGSLCKYQESYPHYLESLVDNKFIVFNLGLPGADIKSSFYTLLYFIRLGMIPDTTIFLDGINEKQAWFQAKNNYDKYEELDYQYHPFLRLIEKANKYDSFSNYINYSKKKTVNNNNELIDYLQFVKDQSSSYNKTKDTIEELSKHWNFKTIFFLQPTVFDFINNELNDKSKSRYQYLKALYKSILKRSENTVFDISQNINLSPEMFFDWQHCNGDGNHIIAKKILEYF